MREIPGWFLIVVMTVFLTPSLTDAAGKRVALVIGNSEYEQIRPLSNPEPDATAVAERLRALGFELLRPVDSDQDAQMNLTLGGFLQAKQALAEAARGAEIAMVYYAGHGAQLGKSGDAYVLPVEVKRPERAFDIEIIQRNSVSLDTFLEDISGLAGLTVAVFDACREIPEFDEVSRSAFGGGWRGLSRPKVRGKSTLIAYSAAAGELAADGTGDHSPYTQQLLSVLDERPDQQVTDLFLDVASRVNTGRQQPEVLIQGVPPRQFYFKEPRAPAPGTTGLGDVEAEIAFWNSIAPSRDCADYEVYLTTYPDGRFARLAQSRQDRYCTDDSSSNEENPAPDEEALVGGMGIREMLAECDKHLKANRLTTGRGGNAFDCYTEALQIDPGNRLALGGITTIEERYIAMVERELAKRDADRASTFLDRLRSVNAERPELEILHAKLATLSEVSSGAADTAKSEQKGVDTRSQPEVDGTGESESPVLIAVVPFEWEGTNPPPQQIADVVEADLVRSGRFDAVSRDDFLESPHDNTEIRYKNWRLLKTEALVVGRMKSVAPGRYEVRFRLMDVYKERQLAGYQFVVEQDKLRKVAHQISDIIYEALIGKPAAFDTRIAYVTVQGEASTANRYLLMVADSDGYGAREILSSTHPIKSPAWSPNGERLAYVSFEGGRSMVYVQEVFSGKRTRVANFEGMNSAPAWSPEGGRLALTLSRDGNPEIYVIQLSDKTLKRITNHQAVDKEPSWSPDGRSIVFTSDRAGTLQIYQVRASGGEPSRISFEGSYNARASFSPSGDRLVMVTNQGGGYQIGVLDLSNRALRVLSGTNLSDSGSPAFAPNGDMILYADKVGGKGILAAISSDGRVKQRLRFPGGSVGEPAWSPFNQKL